MWKQEVGEHDIWTDGGEKMKCVEAVMCNGADLKVIVSGKCFAERNGGGVVGAYDEQAVLLHFNHSFCNIPVPVVDFNAPKVFSQLQ